MSAVPKLRFPEFDGEWQSKKLGEIASFRRGSFPQPYGLPEWYDEENGMPFVQVFDVDDNYKLKPYTKQNISKIAEGKSVFVPKGSIIITIQGSIGRIALTQYDSFVDRTLLIFTGFNEPISNGFFLNVIHLLFEEQKKRAPGGTIKTITKEVLSKFDFHIPSLPEQQKIASFLSSVDKKIDLLRQKKDALELYKKGLMQKIFSQEIRFKQDDGSDFPDWEEVTVGDMAERHVRGLTSSTLNFVEKGYPVYGASGVIGYIDNYLSEQRYIGVVKDGAGVGRVFEAVKQSSLLSTMESIIPKSGFSFGFVKQVIKDIDFKKFTTGSTIPHVYFKD